MTKNPLGLWTGKRDGEACFMGFTHLIGKGNAFRSKDFCKRYSVTFDEFYDPYSYKNNKYVGPVNLVRWSDD